MASACVKAAAYGGLIGGALDLSFAIGFAATRDVAPVKLLQIVASGAFGNAAFDGGAATSAAGAAFHFLMSLLWAAAFVAASRRLAWLIARPLVSALFYGPIVFLTMRLIVLPLSAYPFPVTFKPLATALDLASHIFLFALPIAWAARRFCRDS